MTIRRTALALLLAITAGSTVAQQSTTPQESPSPFDTNPACRERTADANAPECVVQQEGQPRQTYPQKVKVKPKPPPTQPPTNTAPASPPVAPPAQKSGSGLR